MDVEILAAVCIMPFTMVVAAQGLIWMIVTFICLPLVLGFYYNKSCSKGRSRFFLGWSFMSFFFLIAIFEMEVVPYLEILFVENFVLMCFVAAMWLCVYFVKSQLAVSAAPSHSAERLLSKTEQMKRSRCEICSCAQPLRTYHCDKCDVCVQKRDHHSVWLDTCIGLKNQKFFLGALLALLLSCFYSSNLTLTTICHPTLFAGMFLVPDDCSDVFGDIHIALCFVSAIYSLIIAAVGVFLLTQQLWLISHNTTYHEWKQGELDLYSSGCFRNIIDFCRGHV